MSVKGHVMTAYSCRLCGGNIPLAFIRVGQAWPCMLAISFIAEGEDSSTLLGGLCMLARVSLHGELRIADSHVPDAQEHIFAYCASDWQERMHSKPGIHCLHHWKRGNQRPTLIRMHAEVTVADLHGLWGYCPENILPAR